MATFVNECVEMLSVIFAFCIFWSYIQSYFHMFLVVYRSQSPCARSLQSKKWTTTHGFAFHTLNIVATVYQHKSGRERGCTPNWKRLRQSISLMKALLCGLLLLRSLANTVCYFERLPPTSWPTKATFRPHDVTMSHTLWDSQMFLWCIMCMSWCIMRFMCMSFRFFVWRWRMAVSFRWATLWPRSPWLCHGPQTSCKAFLASTDSLRPNAKRKELLEKKRKSSSRKRESRNLNQM